MAARTGRVSRVTVDGRVYVELADVAPGFEFGPVLDTVGGLAVGDRIIATPLARDADELVVIGILGGRDAGDYATDEDLEQGLAGKADAQHSHAMDDLPAAAAALAAYPVGALFISAVATSPATLFGGTWTQISDRMLIAVGSNARWDVALETGGSETVTLTSAQSGLPAHSHGVPTATTTAPSGSVHDNSGNVPAASPAWPAFGTTAATNNNEAADASQAHDNMPPFIAVYMWRRTA